jgi:hypothetical protein
MDPIGDDDGDGLVNGLESSLQSNPLNRDTDFDGIDDADEVDNGAPRDTDGDGMADILESQVSDGDGDCLPDEFDADETTAAVDFARVIAKACKRDGVCGASSSDIVATCLDKTLVCDYANVTAFESDETTCDGLDNDCDGATDEGHPDGDGDDIADCADTDRDGDGQDDATDNCPGLGNASQDDADGDNVGDACDVPPPPTLTAFSPSSPTNVTTVEASGTAEALAEVLIFSDASCDSSIGRGTAASDGSWKANLNVVVGTQGFWLQARNRAGLASECAKSDLLLEIDQTPPTPPSIVHFEATLWDADSATFDIIGHAEAGATVSLFTESTCMTPVATETAAEGSFVSRPELPNTVSEIFAQATDTAGNRSECVSIGKAFGQVSVEVTGTFGPQSEVPVIFHYPDGLPATTVLYTDENGQVSVEGFAGFGVTVLLTAVDTGSYSWSSILGMRPGESGRLLVPFYGEVQTQFFSLALSFPKLPDGTSWVKALAPCGSYYLGGDPTVVEGFISVPLDCVSRDRFEVAVVAMDSDSKPLAYLLETDIEKPLRGDQLKRIEFGGAWKNDFLVNQVSIMMSSPSTVQFGASLEVGGDQLEGMDWSRQQTLGLAGETASMSSTVPPIPGSKSRWIVGLSHPARDGFGFVAKFGIAETNPFTYEFDQEADFLPRIYSADPVYVDDGRENWKSLPVALEWMADAGLGRADAMTVSINVGADAGWISWQVTSRARERDRDDRYGRLTLPKFPRAFPGSNILEQAYSLYFEEFSFVDAEEASSFGDILAKCVIGTSCLELFSGFIDESRCCDYRGGNEVR